MSKIYQRKWQQFQTGQITEQQWRKYCNTVLQRVMEKNKDVFERLKVR